MPRWQLAAVPVLVLTTSLAVGCGSPPSQGGGAMPGGGRPATPVGLQLVQPTEIQDASEYVATLMSLRSTTVQPQIDGQITRIFVESGARVAEGADLFQIDARRQQAAVSSQQAERAAREADVAFAKQQAQRAQSLFDAGAISRQELEQAQTALETAGAALRSLDAQLEQQQVQLRYFTVTAPTAGVVGDIPARVGSQVTTQTVLTRIDSNRTLEVHVSVPLERAGDLATGLPLDVLSADGSTTIGHTTVNFVAPHVDTATQTVLVKGTVPNPDGALRASQFVRARLVWKTHSGLTIPVTAVVRINGQFFAFVAEQAPQGEARLAARQRSIKVGPIVGDAYEVLSGLQAGDRLVVSGAQKLQDGAPVVDAAAVPAAGQRGAPNP